MRNGGKCKASEGHGANGDMKEGNNSLQTFEERGPRQVCPFRGTPAPTHPGVYLLHQGRQQFSPDSRTKVTLRIREWGQSTVWRGLLATPPGFCSPEPGVAALFCVPCTCGVTGPGPGGPAFTGDSACTGPPRRHTSQGPWRSPQGRVSPRAKSHTHFAL